MEYTFDSIAGYENEKNELKKICEILNNREKYEQKGAKLPKGLIFYGSAGTGKTLFTKVLANECNLPLSTINFGKATKDSSICKQIKKAFDKAASGKTTTIVYIDELDKILPNANENYYTDRSKSILTQLLTLIDGITSSSNVFFVASCNDYGVLPETMVRPGRIDKKIMLDIPSLSSRVEILNMYAQKSTCTFDLPFNEIAKACVGFSCAALETLINECILASDESGVVSEKLIYSKIYEINNENIPQERSRDESLVCACHNLGHFIAAKTLNSGEYILNLESDNLCNAYFNGVISGINDDDDYDDYDDDENIEEDDETVSDEYIVSSDYYSKSDFVNAIIVLLGGYVAEETVFNCTYNNNSKDLSTIDNILISMSEEGMLGLNVRYEQYRNRNIRYNDMRIVQNNQIFDEIIDDCYAKAKSIISSNVELLKSLIPIIIREETLNKRKAESIITELGGIKIN